MTTSRWETATTLVLVGLMAGGALWGLGVSVLPDLLAAWEAAGHPAAGLQVALLLGAVSGWLAVLVWLGPMARSAAELQWASGRSVAGHREFLARYQPLAWSVALVLALVLVLLPLGLAAPAWWWGGGFTLVLGLLSLAAYAGQCANARSRLVAAGRLAGLAALGVLALTRGDHLVLAALGAAAVVVLLATRSTGGLLPIGDRPPSWLLVRAAESRWAFYASVVLLDGSVVRQVRDRWAAASPYRLRLGALAARPTAVRALTFVLRPLPTAALTAAVTGYLARCVADAGSGTAAAAVVLVGTVLGMVAAAAPMDRWSQAPALARSYAPMGSHATLLVAAAPAAAAWLIAAVAVLAVPFPLVEALVLLVAPPLMVLRRLRSHRAGVGAWVSTAMGAVPLGLVSQVVAGWDVAALALLVVGLA